MIIDLSLPISQAMLEEVLSRNKNLSFGHWGTHFDVMNKHFPLEFLERKAIVLDVSRFREEEIDLGADQLDRIDAEMFVALCSGFANEAPYGSEAAQHQHPQLSHVLIQQLLERKVSIIGLDFAGVRRGKEHGRADQLCADQGVFIVENLCNLEFILKGAPHAFFTAHTYPIALEGASGLPCRVVGRL